MHLQCTRKFPMPGADWEKENMRYMMCFFPLIGIVIGALTVGWAWLSERLQAGEILKSAVYVLIPVAVTRRHPSGWPSGYGGRSFFLSAQGAQAGDPECSHAGAFAVITACCYFLAAFGVWSELDRKEVLVLAGGFVLSRAMSGLGVASFPCAKKTGTLAMFSDAVQERIVMLCLYVLLFLAAGWMCILDPKLGTAAVVGGWLVFFGYFRMSMKQFGGITGDLAGFFVQMCELVMAAASLSREEYRRKS